MTASSITSTIEAEARFVEEGHRVNFDAAAHAFTVVSDTRPGVKYHITVGRRGSELVFRCTCPAGRHASDAKLVPCKHSAGVAHRGEREGWASFNGTKWVLAGPLAV